ncbi:TetR/AcrR family transcriptional regulator [Jeongeupia naejangsanensis]|uniref:TetR/AcrR family transcriptional regulator n=1 Tax=Jeongeupia naejangsanensis TaxID=613195 RepID=A0ABS2BID0_9NEIS|nr:TetR/AcrR family transcriptional regulator [Jeongeupia naejangsanensis]MBM3115361.1 TetR/AcrR family transcriptional regulator [Jeongeupia naejangsanensis]
MKHEQPDTKQHILDTGEAIILGKGFAAVGLTEILTAAGVPKGSFYHYFKSKEQFGNELFEHYFSNYLKELDVLFADDGRSAQTRLMAYWHGWLSTQGTCRCEEQCLVVKLSAEVSDLSEPIRDTIRSGTDRVVARLAKLVEAGLADGSLPAALDPEHTAATLYQLWLGASLLTKIRRDDSALQTALAATRTMLNVND